MNFIILLIVSCLGTSFLAAQAADDCESGSLDNLYLADLLKKSNEGEKCLKEARQVFTKKYNGTEFNFGISPYSGVAFFESASSASAQNVNIINRFLKHFGDLISSVSVSFNGLTVEEGRDVLKQINAHCFASLGKLNLENCGGNELDELKNTFTNVKSMKFSIDKANYVEIRSDNEKLSKFVPNLENLIVGHTKPSSWKFIAGAFPKLTKLNMQLQPKQPDVVDDSHVADLFKGSPQIVELDIWHINLKLLQQISKDLRNLKTLDIKTLFGNNQSNEETANFSSVQVLRVGLNDNEILDNVRFTGLNELDLDVNTESDNKWMEFITNQVNPDIKIFHLRRDNLQAADFLVIPDKLPHLETAWITCRTKFSANDIAEFIEKAGESMKYSQVINMMDDAEKKKLEGLLSDKWDIMLGYYFDAIRVEITRKKEAEPISTGSDTDGASSLLKSHSIQVLALTLTFAFVKLFY